VISESELKAMLLMPVEDFCRVGLLHLHMPASEFVSVFANPDFVYGSSTLELGTAFPRCLVYRFLKSITVYIDVIESRVYQIQLGGDFKGDLFNGVRLRDSVSELKRRNSLVRFIVEEEYIYIHKCPLVFGADDDIRFDSRNLSNQIIENARIRQWDEVL